jgi:hypothetical protein
VRACRSLPESPTRFRVEIDLRIEGDSLPGRLIDLETPMGSVSIRRAVDALVVAEGEGVVATGSVMQSEVWTRTTLEVDLDARSFTVHVRPTDSRDAGRPETAALAPATAETARICLTHRGVTTTAISVDEISITAL